MSSSKQRYLVLKFPIGEISVDDKDKVRGILKSFVTAIYKDVLTRSKANTIFYLGERLRDKESRKLLLYVLYNFIKNHEHIVLESHSENYQFHSSTSRLMGICSSEKEDLC
jgi:hypothetical protein